MDYMNNSEMFKNKILKISDCFAPHDIPKVYHYFDYYAENKPFYGYAIIEIEEWYDNNSAKFFYNAISDNKGKMVYDDPYYWDVEFYHVEVEEEKNEINKPNINLKIEVNNVNDNQDENKHNDEDANHEDANHEDANHEDANHEDANDEEYVFVDDDNYCYDFYKKLDNSPQKTKKRKYSAIIENLKAENNDLRQLLIKKQKNYKKNNKKKDNKPSWYRRLRVKAVE
jgi:hypothetical protein